MRVTPTSCENRSTARPAANRAPHYLCRADFLRKLDERGRLASFGDCVAQEHLADTKDEKRDLQESFID